MPLPEGVEPPIIGGLVLEPLAERPQLLMLAAGVDDHFLDQIVDLRRRCRASLRPTLDDLWD